jgi:hypothetical protein
MTNTKSAMNPKNAEALRTRYPSAGRFWKSVIVVASLMATSLGWLMQPRHEQPTQQEAVSADVAMHTNIDTATPARTVVATSPAPNMLRPLPSMPQKPVFERPVTRTRRS